MSFVAKFFVEVDGQSISRNDNEDDPEGGLNVLHCTFDFTKPIDLSTGISHGHVQAGLIQIDIESTKSTGLLSWLLYNRSGTGKIVFYRDRGEGGAKEKVLNFERAILVEYRETFDAINSAPMITHFEFFANKITVNDVETSAEIEWEEYDGRS